MKKVKINAILSSIMVMLLSVSLIAGATFALFTSKSNVDISIKSGTVDVAATVDENSIQTKSLNNEFETGADHLFGGTAVFTENTLDLSNIVPGDGVKFNINVKNNSTVNVKYMATIAKLADDGLFAGLEITVNGEKFNGVTVYTGWKVLEASTKDVETITVVIEMPRNADDTYQNKTCKISYVVEAVQGNAETPEVVRVSATNEDLVKGIKEIFKTPSQGEEATKSAEIHLTEGNFSIKNDITAGQLNGKTVTFIGEGENTVYGSTYTAGRVGEYGSDYSLQNADVTFKKMTINLGEADYNGFVRAKTMVFEDCVINGRGSYWGESGVTTFKNCTFNDVNGGYNFYTYSAQDYVFEGCTFNSSKGKFFNLYKESYDSISNIEIKNCTFNGNNSNSDKAVLCVKLFRGNNWKVVWTNNTVNNVKALTESSEFSSGKITDHYGLGYYQNIFGVRADGQTTFTEADKAKYSETVITVDGVIRFTNCEVK